MAHAGYLACLFVPQSFTETVARTLKDLEAIQDKFDFIAFRGLSGSLIAFVICHTLKKGMVVVRKDKKDEQCHSVNLVESEKDDIGRYVILDDQISTGATLRTILEKIKGAGLKGDCVGIYTHQVWVNKGDVYAYQMATPIPRLGRFQF